MFRPEMCISVKIEYAEDEEMLRALTDAGFKTIDVDLCSTAFQSYEIQEEEHSRLEVRLAKLRDCFKFNAVHVSFGKLWDLSAAEPQARKRVVARVINVCNRAAAFGIRYAVVHTCGTDDAGKGDRTAAIRRIRDSLQEISLNSHITICVENLPRQCIGNSLREMRAIVDDLNVKCVIDLNHIFLDDVADFIFGLKDKTVTLHVSDNDGADERHMLPSDGVQDWMNILSALEESGYSGVFTYEVGLGKKYIPDLGEPWKWAVYTPFQVAENYSKLMSAYDKFKEKADCGGNK